MLFINYLVCFLALDESVDVFGPFTIKELQRYRSGKFLFNILVIFLYSVYYLYSIYNFFHTSTVNNLKFTFM